jgi:hypothetical protein
MQRVLQGAESLQRAQKMNADLQELKLPTYILDLQTMHRFSGVLKERCHACVHMHACTHTRRHPRT